MFCIVKFPDENDSVAVIPHAWVREGDSCMWPPFPAHSKRFADAVKNHLPPASVENWTVCKAKILKLYDSYEAARRNLKLSTLTSELSESEDDAAVKGARRRPIESKESPRKKSRSSGASSVPLSYPLFPSVVEAAGEGESFVEDSIAFLSDTTGTASARSESLDEEPVASTLTSIEIIRVPFDNSGLTQTVVTYLAEIKMTLDIIEAKVDRLNASNDPVQLDENDFQDLPFQSWKALEGFAKKAREEKAFRDKVMDPFSSFGGRKFSLHVGSILGDLVADELAQGYSWRGLRGNRNFSELGLLKLNFVAVRSTSKNGSSATRSDVKECIESWLRHAKDRIVTKSKRAKAITEPFNSGSDAE